VSNQNQLHLPLTVNAREHEGAARGLSLARRAVLLVLLGAVVGPIFDFAHVHTGAIGYARPLILGLDWWVPLVYIGAAVGIGLSHPWLDRMLGRRSRWPHTRARLAVGLAGVCAIWLASGAIPLDSVSVTAILAPASLALWWALDRTWQGLIMACGTALSGVLVELTLTGAGLFHHNHRDMLGLAYWLPWLYVAGSVGIGNIGRALAGDARGT
jgi:Insulin-induced protein (INSIG)